MPPRAVLLDRALPDQGIRVGGKNPSHHAPVRAASPHISPSPPLLLFVALLLPLIPLFRFSLCGAAGDERSSC